MNIWAILVAAIVAANVIVLLSKIIRYAFSKKYRLNVKRWRLFKKNTMNDVSVVIKNKKLDKATLNQIKAEIKKTGQEENSKLRKKINSLKMDQKKVPFSLKIESTNFSQFLRNRKNLILLKRTKKAEAVKFLKNDIKK